MLIWTGGVAVVLGYHVVGTRAAGARVGGLVIAKAAIGIWVAGWNAVLSHGLVIATAGLGLGRRWKVGLRDRRLSLLAQTSGLPSAIPVVLICVGRGRRFAGGEADRGMNPSDA